VAGIRLSLSMWLLVVVVSLLCHHSSWSFFAFGERERWSSKICLHLQRFVFGGKVGMGVCVHVR